MANFQLDKLVLNLNSGLYDVSGVFNANISGVPVNITPYRPHLDNIFKNGYDKEMVIDITGNRNKQIQFSSNGIDFTKYGRRDYLCISVLDKTIGREEETEVAGVVIKDTDYPPPYRAQSILEYEKFRTESAAISFIIKNIEIQRQLVTNNFEIKIDMNFSGANYTAVDFAIKPDTLHHNAPVLVLQVKKNAAGATSGTVSFPTGGLLVVNLKNFTDRGLAVIITEDSISAGINWNNVAMKKSLFFIDTPIISRT